MATTIDWPSSLPQVFQQQGFSDEDDSGLIITNVGSGFKKRRPRYTATSGYYAGDMIMTNSQMQIFKAFVKTTLGQGSLSFNFPDQLTTDPASNLVECRMLINSSGEKLYTNTPDNDTSDWRVSFGVEVLP